ncbi:MAG: SGNH/GDSL hydrolase family protein [Rubrobacter sp.]|nr:SGNH/GDSL hydrolase family protein [Rubrobacter sp.]
MSHVVLLGDSIFDNAPYIGDTPDLVRQLRQHLPHGSKATLNAIDVSTTEDVHKQLRRLPKDASHLIVSAGGNDALGSSNILNAPARSTAEALLELAGIANQFEHKYQRMLTEVLAYELPTAICTVYYPRFADWALQTVAVTGLTVFNDCIIRAAFAHGIPLLDLRFICTDEGDYANSIEPSSQGGEDRLCDLEGAGM